MKYLHEIKTFIETNSGADEIIKQKKTFQTDQI